MTDINELTENQKIEIGFAIRDMRNDNFTLWVNRLKEDYPDIFEHFKAKFNYTRC